MAKNSTTKSANSRVKVKDLPRKRKKLTTGTMKTVKGGLAVDPSDPSGNTVFVEYASGGVSKTTNVKPGSK